jgi:hypothetical protein
MRERSIFQVEAITELLEIYLRNAYFHVTEIWCGHGKPLSPIVSNVLSRVCVCDYRRVMDWWLDLLTTYTPNSELHAVTTPWRISTIHKSPQHPLSFPASCVLTCRSLATASNSGDRLQNDLNHLSSLISSIYFNIEMDSRVLFISWMLWSLEGVSTDHWSF